MMGGTVLQCLGKNRGLVDWTVDKWQIESRFAAMRGTWKKKGFVEKQYQKVTDTCGKRVSSQSSWEWSTISPEVSHLLHFLIVKLRKSITKVRIVFDCSAKCDGISLNDVIHAGLKLQRELFDVFLCFRCIPVVLVCDIHEMCPDRDWVQGLTAVLNPMARWRNRPQPGCWVLQSFLERTQPWKPSSLDRKNARLYQSKYPLAAETALESTYMDDLLDSVEGEEKGIELCHCWVEVNPVYFKSSRSTVKGCSLLLWQQGWFMVDPWTRKRFWPLCWICEIQMYTDPAQWQDVPTEQNLADLGSRGTGPVEFAESPLWWDGPEWLSKKKRECPKLQLVDHPPTIMPEMNRKETGDRVYRIHVAADKPTTECD